MPVLLTERFSSALRPFSTASISACKAFLCFSSIFFRSLFCIELSRQSSRMRRAIAWSLYPVGTSTFVTRVISILNDDDVNYFAIQFVWCHARTGVPVRVLALGLKQPRAGQRGSPAVTVLWLDGGQRRPTNRARPKTRSSPIEDALLFGLAVCGDGLLLAKSNVYPAVDTSHGQALAHVGSSIGRSQPQLRIIANSNRIGAFNRPSDMDSASIWRRLGYNVGLRGGRCRGRNEAFP